MPSRPLRICRHAGCSELVASGYCAAHQPAPQRRASAAARGYRSPHWAALRLAVFRRDRWICQACGKLCGTGATTPPPDRAHCDHRVPRRAGGTDTLANLETLCGRCHSAKTAREDGGFGNNRAKTPPPKHQTSSHQAGGYPI